MANPDPSQPSAANAEESHTTKGLLRLTMACNERCPFCNVPAEDYSPQTPPMSDVLEELQTFIERGDQTLTISGGEPTLLRSRLLQLIVAAREGGIRFVEVQTNAVLIDAAYADALFEAGMTSAFVSLLSHIPEHHDELAGLSGAFPRCMAGIDALLDAGIRVALNPVTARLTQDLVGDYVQFVAKRLARVRSISMSAVQPHGRAAANLDLMPDYDRLGTSIRGARRIAADFGIELLNPYCGLPLCVGWEDGLEQSVEAIEATLEHRPQGLDNQGNKRHGEVCIDCHFRSRCGGAWHAYWDHRGGRGLHPPAQLRAPWETDLDENTQVICGFDKPPPSTWAAPTDEAAPVRWLWTDALDSSDLPAIREHRFTHLALRIDLTRPIEAKGTLNAARKLTRGNQFTSPQRQIQLHVECPAPPTPMSAQTLDDGLHLSSAIGASSLTITGADAGRYRERLESQSIIKAGVFFGT
jgi:MoaA/NifB/PqqE/SkfB family radical SAM enzyme